MKLISLRWWMSVGGEGRSTGTDVFEVPDHKEVDKFLGDDILEHLTDQGDGCYFTKFEIAALGGYAIADFGVSNVREIKSTTRKVHRLSMFKYEDEGGRVI